MMKPLLVLGISMILTGEAAFADAKSAHDYVQDGLVAQWDGFENLGPLVRSGVATVWVDHVNGVEIPIPDWVTVESNALVSKGATGKSYPRISSIEGLSASDGKWTLEIVQQSLGWVATDNYNNLQAVFSTPRGTLGYRQNKTNGFYFFGPSSTTKCSLQNWEHASAKVANLHTTAAVLGTSKDTSSIWMDGVQGTVNYNGNYTADNSTIFGFFQNARMDIRVYAVRVYNRALTAAELAANRAVDEVRFVDGECGECSAAFYVAGDSENLGAVTPGYGFSAFASGEEMRCVAPLAWTNDAGTVRADCLGWTLQKTDGTTLTGDENEVAFPGDASYADARLTWRWAKQFKVKVAATAGGSVDWTERWIDEGAAATTVATPGASQQFLGWSGDSTAFTPTLTVDSVTKPMSFVAVFGPADWRLTHVSTMGDDTGDGSATAPYMTVQKGVDNAGENGVVVLAAGTYGSSVAIQLTNNVSLVGCAAANTGVTLKLTATSSSKNVLKMTSSSSVVTNLTLTNNGGEDGSGLVMSAGLLTHCRVVNCITKNLTDNGGGINMTDGTVRNCEISGCDAKDSGGGAKYGAGIYMTGGLVENCRILKNGLKGYGSYGAGGGVYMTGGTLRGCLIAGNKKYKYGSGVCAKGGTVENCTIVGNSACSAEATATGVRCEGSGTTFCNNLIWGNFAYDGTTAKNWSYSSLTATKIYNNNSPTAISVGSNNIAVDPLFVDAANGDYHLGYSACVDGGANKTWMETAVDMDGTPRIVGDTVDIGCYERVVQAGGLECMFEREVIASQLDTNLVAFAATVVGDTEGLVYYWTFTRADGQVVTVSGADCATVTNALYTGTWSARLDVTNAALASASSEVASVAFVGASKAYVNLTGSATYPYETPEKATASPEAAFAVLGEGGTLYVDEGAYVLAKPLEMTSGHGSRIVAPKGPDMTSVRLDNVKAFNADAYRGITLAKASAWVEGLTLTGGSVGPCYAGPAYGTYGLVEVKASGATITNCVFRDARAKSYGTGGEGLGVKMSAGLVVDCRFENLDSYGSGGAGMNGGTLRMTGGTADRIVIDGCYQTGDNTTDGSADILYAEGGAVVKNALVCRCRTKKSVSVGVRNATLINCTIACNTNTAVASAVRGTAPNQVTYYNVLAGGVATYGSGSVKNCIVADNWSTTLGCMTNLSGVATYTLVNDRDETFVTEDNHNRVGDPKFRSVKRGDFRPYSFSPAVNGGDWTALGATKPDVEAQLDLSGAPRLLDGQLDMGCYEKKVNGITLIVR